MDGFPVTIQSPRQMSAVVKWDLGPVVSYDSLLLEGLNADTVYEVGTVLGQVSLGAQAVAAVVAGVGNTGNGVFTEANPAAAAGALAGTYRVEFTAAAANSGYFMVLRPDGKVDGFGKVGTAYVGSINFTIADGAADFVPGDYFTIAVSYAAGSMKYVQINPAATDGSQNFAGILCERAFIPDGVDTNALGMVRDGAVLASALLWPNGMTNNQIAAALAQALAVRIITKNDG